MTISCVTVAAWSGPLDMHGSYSLWNRAPRERLRPIGPEPHPYTTDPGWFQLEIDPLSYTRNRDSEERTRAFDMPALLKIGLFENIDLQFGFELLLRERTNDLDTGDRERDSGFGDMMIASKINLWGNDGGDTAMAVQPFIMLPTARHDGGDGGASGGVMFPTAWALDDVWTLEITPSVAAVRNSNDDGYVTEFAHLTVFTRELWEDLEGFVELENAATTESGQTWEAIIATGLTWEVNPDTVLESGVGFGLNDATDDLTVYLKLVQRF